MAGIGVATDLKQALKVVKSDCDIAKLALPAALFIRSELVK